MIVLNLKEIFERETRFEGRYSLSPQDIKFPPDIGEIKEPVEVYVEITRDDRGYNVHLDIKGKVELECSRCLEVFEKDLSQTKNKHIERYPVEETIHLSPEDLDVSFMEEPDLISLEDLVREELILEIPMKPLCRPDCPGIDSPHLLFGDLEDRREDPRFAILKNLLRDPEVKDGST
ncbi:MAG: YceD family protein [Aquificota bacterium]|nr:YceD family protein [Aquificota bacterium]